MLTARLCRYLFPNSSKPAALFSSNRRFDEEIKSRFRKQKAQEEEDLTPQQQEEVEDFAAQVQEQLQNESVLKTFRKEVFDRSTTSDSDMVIANKLESYDKELKAKLSKGSKAEQLSSAQALFQMFVNDKEIFGSNVDDPVLHNYANYAAYKAAVVKPVPKKPNADLHRTNTIPRMAKFMNSLGPDYIENQLVQQDLNEAPNMTLEKYAKEVQSMVQNSQADSAMYQPQEFRAIDSLSPEVDDDYNDEDLYAPGAPDEEPPRISPQTVNKIYQLYTQGWSVRDLSKRFGLMPARIKYFVWARAQFYFEILPKYGFKHVKAAMEWEMAANQEVGYMDYGLDLEKMKDGPQQMAQRIHCWNNKMVDIARENDVERYDKALEAKEKRKEFSRYIKMPVGTEGKWNRMYYLYDWKIFRGKGSDHYHLTTKTFKKLFKPKPRETYY